MLEFLLSIIGGILGNSADRAIQGFLDAVTPPSTFERWIVRLVARAFAPSHQQAVYEEWIAQLHFAKRRERLALIVGLVSGLPAQVRHPVGAKRTNAGNRRWSRVFFRIGSSLNALVLSTNATTACAELLQKKTPTLYFEPIPMVIIMNMMVATLMIQRSEDQMGTPTPPT